MLLHCFRLPASSLRAFSVLRPVCLPVATASRSLHATNVHNKKKPSSRNDQDGDAFVTEEEEDLFASPGKLQPQTKTDSLTSTGRLARPDLGARRSERFQKAKKKLIQHPAYAAAYILQKGSSGKTASSLVATDGKETRSGRLKHPPSRATLGFVIGRAYTRAELLELVDIFRIYRAMSWPIDALNRLDFIGRCVNIKAPDIALAILHHRPKFGIDIPSLSSARALMQSLFVTPCPPPNAEEAPLPEDLALPTSTPFTHGMLLANLFDTYALPPVEADKVTRVLLLGRCLIQLKDGEDVEDANMVIQRVREFAEKQAQAKAGAQGAVINSLDPKVGNSKLVVTSRTLKERGKSPTAAQSKNVTLDGDNLTWKERAWVHRRINKFVEWAQAQDQDVSWVENMRVAEI